MPPADVEAEAALLGLTPVLNKNNDAIGYEGQQAQKIEALVQEIVGGNNAYSVSPDRRTLSSGFCSAVTRASPRHRWACRPMNTRPAAARSSPAAARASENHLGHVRSPLAR